jgi:hypothetical protein
LPQVPTWAEVSKAEAWPVATSSAAAAALATGPLSAARLRALGAEEGVQHGHYELAYCALPGDVAELGTGRGSAA